MRVDLDEFDTPEPDKVWKVEVYQDQSGEYLPHPNFHPWDDGVLDWTAKAHNALPAIIAELRAAREVVDRSREVVHMAMSYDVSPLCPNDLREALSFYDHVREEATKGDG